MKRITLYCLILINSVQLFAQQKSAQQFQEELDQHYADAEKSPLTKKDRRKFKGHPFFDIDSTFIVVAQFKRTPETTPFQMKTTTDRLPTYEKYGEATFKINGVSYTLNLYQSHRLREVEKYKNDLFLPFIDATSGNDSYGGGRFIDLLIPKGDEIIIDFNQAYNPYCAYNHAYSCPIPPKENDLNVRIEAGVMYRTKH